MNVKPSPAMGSEDAEERRLAVAAAIEYDGCAAVELVMQGLADRDWRVRKEAVAAAVMLEGEHDLCAPLRDAVCQGENVGLRNAALEVFARLGHRAVGCLMAAYHSVAHGDLKFIIEALGSVREPEALPLLVEATVDSDSNVVASAIDALARIGGPEAEAALAAKLRSNDPFQRMAALDGLARLEAPVPWEAIEPLLEDRLVRRVALSVLGRCGDARAVAPLIEALADPSSHFVAEAVVSVAHLYESHEGARASIGEALAGASEVIRGGLRLLAHEGSLAQRQAAILMLLLARDESSLEGAAVLAAEGELLRDAQDALRSWGFGAIDTLLELATRGKGVASGTALELAADLAQLEELSESDRVRLRLAVRSALENADAAISVPAARSMIWFASGEDAAVLVQAALRGPEDLSRAASTVLERLGQSAPQQVLTALRGVSFGSVAGPHLIRPLAATGSEEAFELLQSALSAESPETRAAAVEALGTIGGRAAAELVGYALTDESPVVQVAAARVLGSLRDESGELIGLDGLLLGLESELAAVQSAAARALGEAKVDSAASRLEELTRSTAPGVAFAAVGALREIGAEGLPDLLVETLGHPDEEVVKQALRAIAELGGERAVPRMAIGLLHGSWDVRALAARLLGADAGGAALQALHDRRQVEEDSMVLQAIAEALGAANS